MYLVICTVMVIEGPFYRLIPINDSSPRFDLELLCDIGGKNPRKEFKVVGYGFLLESAVERCIHYAVRRKFGKDEVVTLGKYLDEFKKAKEEIELQIYGSTRNSSEEAE